MAKFVSGYSLYSTATNPTVEYHARYDSRVVRRRDGTAADLCQGCTSGGGQRFRLAASYAFARSNLHGDSAGQSTAVSPQRASAVVGSSCLRGGNDRVRAVEVVSAVVGGALCTRGGRQHFGGDPRHRAA